MLDARVVKMNGQILWASEEPDLLWALRGGSGSFGGTFEILGQSMLPSFGYLLRREVGQIDNVSTYSRDII